MKRLLRLLVALALCSTIIAVCTADTEYGRTVIYQFVPGSSPIGVAIDANGDYIVAETVGGTNSWDNALSRIEGSTRSVIYSSSDAMDIYDVAIDSQGNFFIAESFGASKVTKLSKDGTTVLWQYAERNFVPISVMTDTDDGCVIYWTDPVDQQYLIKLSAGGAPGFKYEVPYAYRGTGGLAIDNDGNYLLATGGNSYSGGAGALLKFDRDDGSYSVIHEFEAESCPTAVQVDSNGNYFVIGHWDNRLVKITPTGDMTTIYQFESGTYPARFTMDSEGNFIVPEAGKDILSKISLLNVAPELNSIGNKEVNELTALTFKATATDTDLPAQTLTFSLVGAVPTGASIDPSSGVFSWTPAETQGSQSYTFTVRVTDTGSPALSDEESITVIVNEDNVAPDILGAYASPSSLWPVNNKFVDITILGVTDPDDEFTIAITAITSDEPTTAGGKNRAPDADPACIGTDSARIRAERNGNGNGRVYEITFIATDNRGAQSEGTVTVCVPHDQGKGSICIDDGQLYAATEVN